MGRIESRDAIASGAIHGSRGIAGLLMRPDISSPTSSAISVSRQNLTVLSPPPTLSHGGGCARRRRPATTEPAVDAEYSRIVARPPSCGGIPLLYDNVPPDPVVSRRGIFSSSRLRYIAVGERGEFPPLLSRSDMRRLACSHDAEASRAPGRRPDSDLD